MYTKCIHGLYKLLEIHIFAHPIIKSVMKHRLNFIFVAVFLLCPFLANAQQKLIDSLRTEVARKDISPKQKVVSLSDLGKLLRYHDLDEAIKTGKEAIRLSEILEDKQYAAYAWANMYYIYRKTNDDELIKGAVDSTLIYAEQSDSKLANGLALKTKSNYYWVFENQDEAIPYLQQASDLLEQAGNASEVIASIDYMLTGTFSTNGDLQNTEKYARHSLKNAEISGNYSNQCIAGLCMGTFFEDKYIQTNNPSDLDSALYYTNYAVEVFTQRENMIKERFTGGTAALNHAAYLWKHRPDTPQDTIFGYLQKSVLWSKAINDQPVITRCYGLINDYYVQQGKEEEAKQLMNSFIRVMNEAGK